MKSFVLSTFLILLGAIPIVIRLYNFVNNGGQQWPMIWSNEAIFWGCIFSIFPIAGVYISHKSKGKSRRSLYFSLIFALIVILPSYVELAFGGLDRSSKGDTSALDLIGFWSSHWWE